MMKKTGLFFIFSFFIFSISSVPVLQISMPRSGTHLLRVILQNILEHSCPVVSNDFFKLDQKTLEGMDGNAIMLSHAVYHETNVEIVKALGNTIKVVFISRDPRDLITSYALHEHQMQSSATPFTLTVEEIMFDRMGFMGYETYGIGTIDTFYRKLHTPWKGVHHVYATTFERLIGPKGGGDLEVQIKEIIAIARHVGVELSRKEAHLIAEKSFDGVAKKGKIGIWKDYFSYDHKMVFKYLAGQLLIDLGYEKDMNW